MNPQHYQVLLNGKALTVPAGTRIENLLIENPHPGKLPAIGALVNNRAVSLSYRINANTKVESIDLTHREGMDIYRRSAQTLLYAAFKECAPQGVIKVGQSVSNAYFFETEGAEVTQHFIEKLDTVMRRLVQENHYVHFERLNIEDAIERLRESGVPDQAQLVSQLHRSEVSLARLSTYLCYVHGPMMSRTGLIQDFHVRSYEHGLVLMFPNDRGYLKEHVPPQPKLFSAYIESKRWNALLETRNIAELNQHCMTGNISELIKVSEALHEKKVAAIADQIVARKDARLILIAGPSSSGKTTFCKRLSIQLKVHGIQPVAISMDEYFKNHELTPRNTDGSYNFDCIEALDTDLINQHLQMLMRGEEIHIPTYSFHLGKRTEKTHSLQLKPGQILIMEGIHGMNELVSSSVARDNKFKIYVSALTQLCIDFHNRIFTSDSRLIRRMIRDRLYRGSNAAKTLAGWESVRKGESQYIFPFQENADAIFNSALIYEPAVLKPYAERFLREVPYDHPSFNEANRLVKFFSFFIPIMPEEVPPTSIIREFIGGSTFNY